MHVLPAVHRDDGCVFGNGAVVGGNVEHFKIFRPDALLFQLAAQIVYKTVPAAADEQHLAALQLFGRDQRFRTQRVRHRHGEQYLFIVHVRS